MVMIEENEDNENVAIGYIYDGAEKLSAGTMATTTTLL
jgi:hypothetical protein